MLRVQKKREKKRAQVAVYSNVRTTIGAQRAGWSEAFNVAFRAGSVMGFALTGMAVLVLYVALWGYRQYFGDDVSDTPNEKRHLPPVRVSVYVFIVDFAVGCGCM